MSARDYAGKVAWITGASAGIGRALALDLARRGADVAVSARREDRLRALVAEIEASGRRGLAVPCDVTQDAEVAAAVARIVRELGRIDVAVANAGFSVAGSVERLSAEDWRRQLDVNVVGVALTARHVLPELRKTQGRLALVSSVSGMLATPGYAAYTASKYAVRGLGQTIAMELAGSGASCTTVYPGFVQSEIAQVGNDGVWDPARKDRRPRRLLWPAARAAAVIADAILRRDREYVFTAHGKLGAFLGRHAPGLVHYVVTRNRHRVPVPDKSPR